MLNQLGLTFARASHKALCEFTDALLGVGEEEYTDCYDTGPAATYTKRCPPKLPKPDDRGPCHIGCSTEPPNRCPD